MKSQQKDQNSDIVFIAKGGGLATFGKVCGVGFKFFTRLMLTRIISIESVGMYFLGITAIEFTKNISLVGFHSGMLKYVSVAHGKGDISLLKGYIITAFKVVIPCAAIFSLNLYFFSDTISIRIFHNPDLSKVIQVLSVTIPIVVVTTICLYAIQACRQIKYRVYVQDISEPLVRLVFLGVCVFMGYKLMGVLAAYIISVVSSFILSLHFLNKKVPFSIKSKITRNLQGELFRFSLTQISSNFITTIMTTSSTFMIGYFLAAGSVGVYNIASHFASMGTVFLLSFNQVLSPMVSCYATNGDLKRIKKNYQAATKLIFLFSFPVYLVMVVFSRETLMIFGKGYVAGANCLVLVAIGQMVNSASGSVGVILNMAGKHVLNLYNNIGMLISTITLCYFLIPRYGIVGAAIAGCTSTSLGNLSKLILVFVIFRIQPYNLSYLKPVFTGIVLIMLFGGLKQILSIELNLPYFLAVVACYFSFYFFILKLIGLTEDENIVLDKLKYKFLNK